MRVRALIGAVVLGTLGVQQARAQIHVVPAEPTRDLVLYKERASYDDLSERLEAVRERYGLPAIAGAVFRTDGTHAMGVAGVRSLVAPEPATLDDPFHIGAITKTVTATLAGRMVEAGEIRFDTPLTSARTMLRDEIDPAWGRVNLGQLLAHRSGLPDDRVPDAIDRGMARAAGLPWRQRVGLCERIFAFPPEAGPGERFAYSSRGYVAAASMMEGVTALNWEDLVHEGIAARLGLESFGFGIPGAEPVPISGVLPTHPSEGREPGQPIGATVPWGHRQPDEPADTAAPGPRYLPVEPHASEDTPVWRYPADGVHMSIRDLATYGAFHLRGARGVQAAPSLISAEMFEVIQGDPLDQGHAMGWRVGRADFAGGATLLAATGTNGMFFGALWLVPEHDIGGAVLINAGGSEAGRAASEVLLDTMRAFVSPDASAD